MRYHQTGNLRGTSEVVKNLIILNVLFFIANYVLTRYDIYLEEWLPLYYVNGSNHKAWQWVTHMFMHAGLWHLFLNMFGLWMFGNKMEQLLGARRFFTLYFLSGFIAAAFQMGQSIVMNEVYHAGLDIPMVGASGAVFGVVGAFTAFFPNTELMIIFLPIPIKAKYLIGGTAVVSLVLGLLAILGITGPGGVAHLAHLGGILTGFFMVRYWNKNNKETLY